MGTPGNDRPHHTELVHEARKAIKRMRALARLLRYELGEKEFDRVNSSLRDAGRRLAVARDADVRLATLERLQRRHPDTLAQAGIKRLAEQLRREREQAGASADEHTTLVEVGEMRRELARWKLVEHDFKTLEPGLRRIYREGRRRHRQVRRRKGGNVEAAHDWRKRVKGLYYALDMLGDGSKSVRTSSKRAERLGEILGEEHDLWMLAAYAREHTEAFGDDSGAQAALVRLVERRRERLHRRALSRGARLYERKPRAFTRGVYKGLTRL
jgi:CHAD domain-containing protein